MDARCLQPGLLLRIWLKQGKEKKLPARILKILEKARKRLSRQNSTIKVRKCEGKRPEFYKKHINFRNYNVLIATLSEVNISSYPGTKVPGLFSFSRAVIFKSGVSCRNIGQEQSHVTQTWKCRQNIEICYKVQTGKWMQNIEICYIVQIWRVSY